MGWSIIKIGGAPWCPSSDKACSGSLCTPPYQVGLRLLSTDLKRHNPVGVVAVLRQLGSFDYRVLSKTNCCPATP